MITDIGNEPDINAAAESSLGGGLTCVHFVGEQEVMAVTRTGATFMFRIEYEEGTPRWFRMDSYAMPPPLGLTVSVASPKSPTRIVFLRHIDSLTQQLFLMTAQSTARTLDQLIKEGNHSAAVELAMCSGDEKLWTMCISLSG